MNESSRGPEGPGGGDPPISGGFPSPGTQLKEEFPSGTVTPPSTDLQALTDTFATDELSELDRELVGDGFTLSRLLGGDNPSPTTASWDTLNESMTNNSNNQNGNGPTSGNSNQGFENQNANNANDNNNPSNPGYRPWEAEANANHALSTSQQQGRAMHPPPYYAAHHHAMVHHQHHHHLMHSHLPSFQSQFNFNDGQAPPNTQAPAGPPVPTSASSRYPPNASLPRNPHFTSLEVATSGQYSPGKYPGRHMVKARRPSEHINQQGSPGKFSQPNTPTPPGRPASASGTTGDGASYRGSASTPGPHTTPNSPVTRYTSDNSAQYLRVDGMLATGDSRSKVRTASLEGSESDNSVRSLRSESDPGLADTPGQVAAISSTDPTPDTITGLAEAFKPPVDGSNGTGSPGLNLGTSMHNRSRSSHSEDADTLDKPTKKKRKRCGECSGCQRKDNCGDCAPCRNEKSHQICKNRRCDRLTEKKVPKRGSFGSDFPGSMFPQGPSWAAGAGGAADWYGSSMGPPSGHNPRTTSQLTFDQAYNFGGGSTHSMSTPMQEFSTGLSQHHAFGLAAHDPVHHSSHRSATVAVTPRATHAAAASFMHDPVGYGGLNGAGGLGYNVHAVAADKNLLPNLGLGMPRHSGNLQPGYPPRPVETSSLSSDSELPSTGYPGKTVTGPPSHQLLLPPRVQEAMVTSTDHRLLLLPSATGQQTQQTFLACSAAAVPATVDRTRVKVVGTELGSFGPSTPSANQDRSTLARTAAAPTQEMKKSPKLKNSQSFVSSIKALKNPTSNHLLEFTTENHALQPKFEVKYDVGHQKFEDNSFEDSKLCDDKNKMKNPQNMFRTPSPKKTVKQATPAMKGRKLLMDGKDEENSSVRSPLEILKDTFADKDLSENLSEDLQNILRAKAVNLKEVSPSCNCAALGLAVDDNGAFYTQLGHASTLPELRQLFVDRMETTEAALRVEKVRFTGKEGVTTEGCPIAKWIIRRTNATEKYLVVVKERYGHQCKYAWVAVSLIQWDGLPAHLADAAYSQIAETTATYGSQTERKCGTNVKKTCACQGSNGDYNGASYTFGCSWTMYTNCCKFCKSEACGARKYRLKDGQEEAHLENICDDLTDSITPHFKKFAPDCFNNMCLFEEVAADCRIGNGEGRPFSGITTVLDFCAHSHKDTNNMIGGCTVVVTLTRPENREAGVPVEDEQFHVLPHYVPDVTEDELEEKLNSGGIEALSSFPRTITIKNTAKKCCKRGRMTAEKKRMLDGHIPENYKGGHSPTSSPKPVRQSPVKKVAKPKEPKQPSPQKRVVPTQTVQQVVDQHELPSHYSPTYHRRPIPSTSTYSSPPLVENQALYDEFSQPVQQSFGQYYSPPPPVRQPIRTIMIDNPCLVRQMPAYSPAPAYSTAQGHYLPQAPVYIPRVPQLQPHTRPAPPAPAYQGGAMPVSNGFVSNIVSQFSDCDSILALLEEAGGREESSLEEASRTQEDDAAAAIYASYTSRLGQLDGAQELDEPPSPLAQLDGGTEDEEKASYATIYNQYLNRLQIPSEHHIEPKPSHNSYRELVPQDQFTPDDGHAEEEWEGRQTEEWEEVPADEVKETPVPAQTSYESECLEAFADPMMGGIALALPHGSILIEVAKAELHATTALKAPNKHNPCRIGLVWYQHKNLHFANHGADECRKKTAKREFRDYLNWLKGEWVMTPSQLHSRQKAGYVFPGDVKVVKSKNDMSTPEDRFRQEDFPDFVPGKFVNGEFQKIIIKEDHNLAVFQENILLRNQNKPHCGKVVNDPEVNRSFDQSYEFSDGADDQSETYF